MKGKIAISCIGLVISYPAAGFWYTTIGGGADTKYLYVISRPDDISFIPSSPDKAFDVLINNGGTYNLSLLASTIGNADELRINFTDTTGVSDADPTVILKADGSFNGVFSPEIVNEYDGIRIELSETFLNGVVGNEIFPVNFRNPDGYILVNAENDSGEYSYGIDYCTSGSGRCVMRSASSGYSGSQQNALREALSVQNNPAMLLRPMQVIHRHELVGHYEFADEFFVSVAPEYYNSKDFQNVGLRLNSGTKFGGNLSVGVGVYIDNAGFQDGISEFDAAVYGGNLRFKYDLDEVFFLRGVVGLSFESIDCDGIKNGNGLTNNPHAFGIYNGVDFGAKFDFASGLYLSPFVGYSGAFERVVDIKQNDSFMTLGNDVGFKYVMDGVTYNYILRLGIDSHAQINADVGLGAWTIADKIGGSVSVGVIDTDYGWSGKFSANVKMSF